MSNAYVHSEIFASLKATKERLPDNLTSVQYLTVLDSLLYNALFPIIQNSRFADTFLSKVLAWQSTNPKRKLAAESKYRLPSSIVLFLLMEDPNEKLKLYKRISFERGITLEIVNRWVNLMEQYETIVSKTELTAQDHRECQRLLRLAGAHQDEFPYAAYQQASHWLKQANTFKDMVLEKYTRMCLNWAQQDYTELGQSVSLNDILQIYMMTASKAINRCDASRGVLTTYLQSWLRSAKGQVVRTYLGEGATQEIDFDRTELEEEPGYSQDDVLDREAQIERVQYLARIFDSEGSARLILGIEERLPSTSIQMLHSYAKPGRARRDRATATSL